MPFLDYVGLEYFLEKLKELLGIKDLVEWSPEMTSNTTPAPYVASGSTELTTGHTFYFAFDAQHGVNQWSSTNNDPAPWISFDFGSATSVSGIVLYARTWGGSPQIMPSSGILYGSLNGSDWNVIMELTGMQNIDDGASYTFKFPRSVEYRYYKIGDIGAGPKGFGDITFLRPVNSLAVAEGINSV